ncbi:MAG: ACT domain-containing protein, partial [Pseudomonadota bacterium]
PKLEAFDDELERWIDVTWDVDPERPERYPARIHVVVINAPGSLGSVATAIGEADANIDNLRMHRVAADYTDTVIDLEVWDLKHLNQVMSVLRRLDVVNRVTRHFGDDDRSPLSTPNMPHGAVTSGASVGRPNQAALDAGRDAQQSVA